MPTGSPPMCRAHLNSLYTNLRDLQASIESLGMAHEGRPFGGMRFEKQAPEGDEPADVLDIRSSLEPFTRLGQSSTRSWH